MNKFLTGLFLLLITSVGITLAQPVNTYINDVVMPSPTAASLGKYGDIPVSYYTGVPSVGIPIYTLISGPLKLPISLSYHAGGMKVGEPVSWVGLGWSLQAGGMISRTVQGRPDEEGGNYQGYMYVGQDITVDANGCLPAQQNQDYVAMGNKDPEPDIFSFSVGGYSGKFYIDADKTSDGVVNGKVVLIPQQDIQVTYTIQPGTTYSLKGFVITLPDGTRYEYGMLSGETDVTLSSEITSPTPNAPANLSGWYLRRISSADKNYSINLAYTPEQYQYDYRVSNGGTGNVTRNVYQAHTTTVNGQRLSSITTLTASVNFVASNDRLDLDNPYAAKAKELTAIKITSGTLCKQFVLGHSYFTDNSSLNAGGIEADKRLRLTSVQEQSCDNSVTAQPYTLSYYGQSGNPDFLPTRLSAAVDHWGFYNGATTNPTSGSLNIPTTSLTYVPITGGNPETMIYGNANRETNEGTMKWGTLSQMTYPTGGSTSFDYEANTYYGSKDVTSAVVQGSLSCYWSGGICPTDQNGPSASLMLTIPAAELANTYYNWKVKHTDDPTCSCSYGDPFALLNVFSGNTLLLSQGGYASCQTNTITELNGKLSDLIPGLPADTPLRFELWGGRSASLFTIKKLTTSTVTENLNVGGLRIKTITSNDGLNPGNDVVKSYSYLSNSPVTPGASSGQLFNQPIYGYVYDGCIGSCQPDGNTSADCPPGSERLRNAFFFEHSLVPLGSFEGYHIGYTAVREYNGANNTGTSTLYQYFNDPAQPFVGIPVLPEPPRIRQGQLFSKGQKNSSGLDLAVDSYTDKSETLQYGQGIYLKVVPYTIGIAGQGGNSVIFWKLYQVPTRPFRYESITRSQDGQVTTTNRQYTGVNHLQMTQETITNSDGRQTVTDYKYPADLSGTIPADQVAAFATLNLLVPLQTTATVAGTLRKGTQTEYAFFDNGAGSVTGGPTNGFIRPYKFYNLEGSNWVLKGTLNSYHGTASGTGSPGMPSQFTKVGWQPETYQWTPAGLLQQRQLLNFSWNYEYLPGTALVSKMTNPDGQFTQYSYDALMRTQQVSARGGNVVTNYQYAYPTLNSPGSIASRGYVKTSTTFTPVAGSGLSTQTSYGYLDGLGRSLQTVYQGKAPSGNDQIRAVAYDNQGRVSQTYEALASGQANGSYQDPGATPFTLTSYEDSPLNRVSGVTPPGWAATTSGYGVNTSGDGVLNYDYATGNAPTFGDTELTKTTTTDGNGNKTISFTDKKGRMLLSRRTDGAESSRSDTYYVYDDKDRLVKVIPPGATWASTELTYGYSYLDNDLVQTKKLPGKAIEQYSYNQRELPERFQDAFLANNGGRWMASQYDEYGRLTAKGVWASGTDGSLSRQNTILANTYSTAPSGITVDKLISRQTMLLDAADPVVNPAAPNGILQTSFSYDAYGRVSGTSGNNHTSLGNLSAESMSYGYDFGDNILSENRTSNSSGGSVSIANSRLFDSWGRLTTTQQSLNGAGATTISQLSYTDKDQLSSKTLGNGLQQVDYGYLPNGLLSSINGTTPLTNSNQPVSQMLSNLSTPSFGATTQDLFRQELQYNNLTAGLNGSVQNSGNIGQLLWQTRGRTTQAYGLSYDYLDRLTGAQSSEYTASNAISNSNYFTESQSFDGRGTITSQSRSGLVKGSSAYTLKPNLDTPTLAQVSGTNQTTTATGVSSIPVVNVPLSVPHNFLNLPTSFSFNAGNRIELLYDGLGTKLRKTVSTNNVVSLVQDYLGGIELRNNTIEGVYNQEGRAFNNAGTYRYEYVLRDHLGNTRLVFTDKDGNGGIDNSEILSESHYYPFGRKMEGAWYQDATNAPYRYLYNGKELSEEFDLNFYDYGARWYDPGLGAWWELDPLAEVSRRWSPYVFSNNNPLRFVDADGMEPADEAAKALQGRVEAYDFANQTSGELGFASQYGAQQEEYGGGDPPAKGKKAVSADPADQRPTPLQLDEEGRPIYPEGRMSLSKDGIEPSFFIEGQIVGGAVAKPFGWLFGRVLGRFAGGTVEAGYINLASQSRSVHILAGDATGGGHAWFGSLRGFMNGLFGSKSMFPMTWSNGKIMNAISDVSINNSWLQQTGKIGATLTKSGQPVRFTVDGVYEGVKIRVITTHTDIITAYPIK